ncbi:SLC13 family permease [Sulfurovum sp.]|uniref:SLC13 family permease n=1 Tax=Sulfurovum sp. TaxID=1969726 RepID=UPI00356417DB
MTNDQIIVIAVLFATMVIFLWGRWRHDLVAMGALLVCVVTGLVPGNEAFSGFSHPAVITVACVLVLGHGLLISGAMDILSQRFIPTSAGPTVSIFALISLGALLSAFMNNVGALAVLMPVAIQVAAKQNLPPGKILMPLAFGSILGGMTTLIGTPTNLIVSEFRATTGMKSFSMFDFTIVGLAVAVFGIVFVGLVGWRLVPTRKQADTGSFDSAKYLSEVRIVEGSKAVDKRLNEAEQMLDEADAQIVSMIRQGVHISAPNPRRVLKEGDILVIEVEPKSLSSALTSLGLKLEEDLMSEDARKGNTEGKAEPLQAEMGTIREANNEENDSDRHKSSEVVIQELVVKPNAILIGRSALTLDLRASYGISLLAISREGHRSIQRLKSIPIKAGDVLLMQGAPEAITSFTSLFGCLPLAPRDIRVPKKGQAVTAGFIMAITVGAAALGLFPVPVLFAIAMFAYIVLRIVPLRSVYTAIDWPVIVLLAAMLPVAGAVASTGTADMIAHFLLDKVTQGDAILGLITLLVVTMFLSDLVNNAATAAVMCPIAISTAAQLDVNADAFLMAVAVGASSAFLTPIGHQNNTLILGPSGFRFGDYWRLGLLLEVIVVVVSVPAILWVWPL